MQTKPQILPIPNLDDDQIIDVVCGLRPCRRGGLRIQAETIDTIGKTVIHNYGHGGCGVTLGFGTAIEAARLVEQHAKPGSNIAVLGAGVVGLTTARQLLHHGYRVTIYADKEPLRTTSVLAGALWLPIGVEIGETDTQRARFQKVIQASRAAFQSIDRERYGIEVMPVYEPAYALIEDRYFNNGTIAAPAMLDELPLGGPPRSGRVFETDFIHTEQFLSALVDEIKSLAGRFVTQRFEALADLAALDEPVLVNALALESRTIFSDEAMYPARGVLVHMKPQPLGYAVHDGYKYMFPRKSRLILGGCFVEDDWNDQPDEAIVAEILAHHRRFFGLG